MKNLHDYSNDVYKCTKCGLCQSVCPVFEQTGLECAVSRGKFNLLNGIIKGDLNMTPKVIKYLDLCLNCNACTQFCPSAINAEEILTCAKNEAVTFSIPFFDRSFLVLIKIFLSIFRFFQVDKVLKIFEPLFFKLGIAGKALIFFNKTVSVNVKRRKFSSKDKSKLKVLYFGGCVNDFINPSVKNATLNLLESQGIEVQTTDFECCGIPHRAAGDLDKFKEFALKNLSKIDADIDYLVTDCASCHSAWHMYSDILDGEASVKAQQIADKTIHINEFLAKLDYSDFQAVKPVTVTFHYPCHLTNFSKDTIDVAKIFKQIKNVEYVEMTDSTKCCGAGGAFFLKHPVISTKISDQKANNILKTEAEIVLTSCPSCVMGLNKGLLQKNKSLPVLNLTEFLSDLIKAV